MFSNRVMGLTLLLQMGDSTLTKSDKPKTSQNKVIIRCSSYVSRLVQVKSSIHIDFPPQNYFHHFCRVLAMLCLFGCKILDIATKHCTANVKIRHKLVPTRKKYEIVTLVIPCPHQGGRKTRAAKTASLGFGRLGFPSQICHGLLNDGT